MTPQSPTAADAPIDQEGASAPSPPVEGDSPEWLDDEIAMLLNQAESLTAELADEFDGDIEALVESVENIAPPEGVDTAKPPGPQRPTPAPAAVTRAEKPAPAESPPLGDLLSDPDATETAPNEPGAADRALAATANVEPVEPADAHPSESDESAQRDPVIDDTIELEAEPGAIHADPVNETEEAGSVDGPTVRRRATTLFNRARSTAGAVRQALAAAARFVLAIPVQLLIIADTPFAGVRTRTRRALGVVALATVVCAALAWLLPWLLTTNPFANMPTGIVTDH